MHTGMLWFDNSQSPLTSKFKRRWIIIIRNTGESPIFVLCTRACWKGSRLEDQQDDRPPLPARSTRSHLDWHRGQKLSRVLVGQESSCPLHLPWNWPAGGFFNRCYNKRHTMTLAVTDAHRPGPQSQVLCFAQATPCNVRTGAFCSSPNISISFQATSPIPQPQCFGAASFAANRPASDSTRLPEYSSRQ
jgi:hypothetical protein